MRLIAMLIVSTLSFPGAVCAHVQEEPPGPTPPVKNEERHLDLIWPKLEIGVMPEIGHRRLRITKCANCEEYSKGSIAPGFVLSVGYRTESLLLAGFGELAWSVVEDQADSLGMLGVLVRYKLQNIMALEPRVFGTNWRHEAERSAANFRGFGAGLNLVLSLSDLWGEKDVAFAQLVFGGDVSHLASRRDAAGLTSVSGYAWSLNAGLRLSMLTRLGLP